MLGKLFKYEWKRIYKLECLLLIIMVAFTAVEALMFFTPMTDFLTAEMFYGATTPITIFWALLFGSSVLACIIAITGLVYGNLIYVGINFEKTMYSDEGYLTHTLPVTPHQLLVSKLLAGGIWTFIIQLVMFVCIFVLVETFSMSISEFDVLAEFREELAGLNINVFNMGILAHYLASYGLLLFGGPFCSISILFGALTIGQLFKRHKGLMGIIIYFGILIVSTMLNNIAQGVGRMTMAMSAYDAYHHLNLFFSLDMALLMNALIAVCLYFLSHYIIVTKLNLN